MDRRNPYEVLGVASKASPDEIKAAYRARSLLFHPDRLADLPDSARAAAQVEMKALNAAYTVLKDPTRRAALDRKLSAIKPVPTDPPSQVPEVESDPTPPPAPAAWTEETRAGHATRYQPAAASVSAHYTDMPGATSTVAYPPYTPPANAPARKTARKLVLLILGEDLFRFLTVAGFTSMGWFAVILLDMALPAPFTLAAAVLYSVTLMVALSFIKPPHRRQPRGLTSVLGRILLTALVPVVLIAVIVFLQVTANLDGGLLQIVFLTGGLAFAMLVHWGVCLASYSLT